MAVISGVGRHSNLGGPQRLNRIDLYGKKLIPMEKLLKVGGAMAPWPGSDAYGSNYTKC